jgi:hypothetical protein
VCGDLREAGVYVKRADTAIVIQQDSTGVYESFYHGRDTDDPIDAERSQRFSGEVTFRVL